MTIRADEFVPVGFRAVINSFGLAKRVGHIIGHVLAKYGDLVSDDVSGQSRRDGGSVTSSQLIFPDHGLLTVNPAAMTFYGWAPAASSTREPWLEDRISWAIEMLAHAFAAARQPTVGLALAIDWLLWDETTTNRLIDHLGLPNALGGLFAESDNFQIQGSLTLEMPNLFPVDCGVLLGRLLDYEHPDNVGLSMEVWHYQLPGEAASTDYTGEVGRAFFRTTPSVLREQIERLFPA
jgi:hypothetical protein